jgi:phenylpropionate dioxygenase-like ring-hydroxylating dioxygenase large terminal subunit
MAALDHWNPVLLARALKNKPVAVQLAGKQLVLFRAGPQEIGALDDCCPHRRMRLSLGKMVGPRLQCRYHGWTYDCHGNGESPGTPKLHAQARNLDAVEKFGTIWVKSAASNPVFPTFEVDEYHHLGTLLHHAHAPLELVVDNFCEIEHTPTAHAIFGYRLDGMQKVDVHFEPTESTVRVINHGPPKRLPWYLRKLIGIGDDYQFNDDWTTYFSPVYSVYQHWWSCPRTGKESRVRWKLFIFFVPVDDQESVVVTIAFAKSSYPGPMGGIRLFRRFMLNQLDHELQLDMQILEGLADKNPSVEGMKLSRFDRVLGLNRERIERIYRGRKCA